jgi:hypothetical protein
MPCRSKLGVKEARERVDLLHISHPLRTRLGQSRAKVDHDRVERYHLVVEPLQALQLANILG